MGKGGGTGQGSGQEAGDYKGRMERVAVPAMPMPMASVCCVLNFLVPGLGTVVAGFSNFCCSRNEDMDTSTRMGSCGVSLGIGLLQLSGTVFCHLGWVWSCVWGGFLSDREGFGSNSKIVEYYHENRQDDTNRQPVRTTTTSLPVVHPQNVYITAQPVPQASNVIIQPAGSSVGRTIPIIQHPQTVLQIQPLPAFVHRTPTAPPAQDCQQDTTIFNPDYTTNRSTPMVEPPPYPGPPPPRSLGSVYEDLPPPYGNLN